MTASAPVPPGRGRPEGTGIDVALVDHVARSLDAGFDHNMPEPPDLARLEAIVQECKVVGAAGIA